MKPTEVELAVPRKDSLLKNDVSEERVVVGLPANFIKQINGNGVGTDIVMVWYFTRA